MSVLKILKDVYYSAEGPERVGFILKGNKIVEVTNVADDPINGFMVDPEDFIKYEDEITGTWHTHPSEICNLSGADYQTFIAFKDYYHYVVGSDGVKCYKWDYTKKALMDYDSYRG